MAVPTSPADTRKNPAKPIGADSRADPWQASDSLGASEPPGNWLLSYSDLMTLLFTFFVMLFAYQKVAPPQSVERAANRPVAAALAQPAAVQTVPVATPVERAAEAPPAAPPPTAAIASTTPETPTVVGGPTAPASGWLSLADAAHPPMVPSPPVIGRPDGVPDLGKEVEISEAAGQVRLEIKDSILFDPASAELKPAAALVLDRLAVWLRGQPGIVAVEGHTDDRPVAGGRYRSNWELSASRAGTVTQGLIERGIPAGRLRATGFADTQPRIGNDTPEGRAKNRRVSVVVFVERGKGVKI